MHAAKLYAEGRAAWTSRVGRGVDDSKRVQDRGCRACQRAGMATLHKEIIIAAPADLVWDAVRDAGALHTRLVPGFVTDTQLDGDVRIVTFGNATTVREPILSIDDARRRMAWGAVGGKTTHYNAVLEVIAEGDGARVVWTTDLLPHEAAPAIAGMQDMALATMRKTLETAARARG